MKEQMNKVSRDMEILRKNKKKILEIESNVTEIKNAFDGFISRLDIAEKKMNELEDMPRKQVNEKDGTKYLRSVGQLQKVQPNCNGNLGDGRDIEEKKNM